MLDLVKILNKPLFVVLGFAFSLIGTIQVIVSLSVYFKNRKQNAEFNEKHKAVIESQAKEIDAQAIEKKTKEVNKEYEAATRRLESELPIKIELDILDEKIAFQTRIIEEAKSKLDYYLEKRNSIASPFSTRLDSIFSNLNDALVSQNAQQILMLFLGVALIDYFAGFLFAGLTVRIITYILLAGALSYIWKKFAIGSNEHVTDMGVFVLGIVANLIYISILGSRGFDMPINYLVCVLAYIYLLQKTKMQRFYTINTIVDLFTLIALFIAIMVNDISDNILFAGLAIQAIMLLCNVVYGGKLLRQWYKRKKTDNDKSMN